MSFPHRHINCRCQLTPEQSVQTPVNLPLLEGIPIQSNRSMVGAKRAVKVNGIIFVSPAMYSLMTQSEGEELAFILENIPVWDMDNDTGFTVSDQGEEYSS